MSARTKMTNGWYGWIGFASLMLILAGMFHLVAGFVGLFQDDIYVTGGAHLWVFDYSQWGWVHMAGGALAILAGLSLAAGHMYGRVFAVLVALASAVANMAFVPVYPIWSLMIVTIDVLVIWAVIAHGSDLKHME